MKTGMCSPGRGVQRLGAQEDAGLLPALHLAFDVALGPGLSPVGLDGRLGRGGPAGPGRGRAVGPRRRQQLVDQGMLGRQHHVGRAEQRVGPGREHVDDGLGAAGDDREVDARTLGPADPVALHLLDGVGPVEQVQVGQQPVGVGGDPHHPLLEAALEHREVAAVGATFGGDLLVGQHGAQARAPVHRRLGEVGQPVVVDQAAPLDRAQLGPRATVGRGPLARLEGGDQLLDGPGPLGLGVVPAVEDLEEDPLRPAVEARIGGGDAAARVVGQAEPAQLPPHVGDVLHRS